MHMDLELKKFDFKTHLPIQRELFRECFPENEGTPVITNEHYLWKFQSKVPEKPSYEYAVWLNNDMIGYYAAIPYYYHYYDKKIIVAMVCDVMTGIKARGKGVFTKMGIYATDEMKKEGLAFSTGYPIRPEVIPGHKKAGWSFPFDIPMYGKFLSLTTFTKNRNKASLRYILNPLLNLWNFLFTVLRPSSGKLTINRYSSKDLMSIAGLDEFFKEWRKNIPIALQKDMSYLKWRLGAPEKNYQIVILRDGDKIVGYSIGRKVIKENVPCFGILDLCLIGGYSKYASLLLKENEKIAKEQSSELLLIMMMKHCADKYKFGLNGYLKTPYKFSFIIKKFDASLDDEKLYNPDNWHLTWIDSDDL